MAEIKPSILFGKLNPVAFHALNSATNLCAIRGDRAVELVHWLHQIFQMPDTDQHRIFRHFQLDASRLAQDLTTTLERLPRGATKPNFSPDLKETVEWAWMYASLLFSESRVRTGHLIVALLKTAIV